MTKLIVTGASGMGKTCFVKNYILTHPHLRFRIVNDYYKEYECAEWGGKVCADDWLGRKCTKAFENIVDEKPDVIVYEWGDSPAPKIEELESSIIVGPSLGMLEAIGVPVDELIDRDCIVVTAPLRSQQINDLYRLGIDVEDPDVLHGNYYFTVCPVKMGR